MRENVKRAANGMRSYELASRTSDPAAKPRIAKIRDPEADTQ
jgi:hypothetical protein